MASGPSSSARRWVSMTGNASSDPPKSRDARISGSRGISPVAGNLSLCVCICVRACMHMCIHVCVQVPAGLRHLCVCVCIRVCIRVCTQAQAKKWRVGYVIGWADCRSAPGVTCPNNARRNI